VKYKKRSKSRRKLYALLVLVLFALGTLALVPWARAQSSTPQVHGTECTSINSCSTSFASSVAAGDIVVVTSSESTGFSNAGNTLTNTAGLAFASLGAVFNGNNLEQMWWAFDPLGGPESVTVSSATGAWVVNLYELAGPIPGAVWSCVGSGAATTSACAATTSWPSGSIVISGVYTGNPSSLTTTSGFTATSVCDKAVGCGEYLVAAGSTSSSVMPWAMGSAANYAQNGAVFLTVAAEAPQQEAVATSASATTLTATYPNQVTPGNTLVVVAIGGSGAVGSLADTASLVWHQYGYGIAGAAQDIRAWVASVTTGVAAEAATVGFTSGPAYLAVYEFTSFDTPKTWTASNWRDSDVASTTYYSPQVPSDYEVFGEAAVGAFWVHGSGTAPACSTNCGAVTGSEATTGFLGFSTLSTSSTAVFLPVSVTWTTSAVSSNLVVLLHAKSVSAFILNPDSAGSVPISASNYFMLTYPNAGTQTAQLGAATESVPTDSGTSPAIQEMGSFTGATAFPGPVKAGDRIVVYATGTGGATSVADSQVNSYATVVSVATTGYASIFCATAASSGALTITPSGAGLAGAFAFEAPPDFACGSGAITGTGNSASSSTWGNNLDRGATQAGGFFVAGLEIGSAFSPNGVPLKGSESTTATVWASVADRVVNVGSGYAIGGTTSYWTVAVTWPYDPATGPGLSLSASTSAATSTEKWCFSASSGTCAATASASPNFQSSSATTFYYYDALKQTTHYTVPAGSASPTLAYKSFPASAGAADSPSSLTLGLTGSDQSAWANRGSAASVTPVHLGVIALGESAYLAPSSWTVSASTSVPDPVAYSASWLLGVSYTAADGNPTANPTMHYVNASAAKTQTGAYVGLTGPSGDGSGTPESPSITWASTGSVSAWEYSIGNSGSQSIFNVITDGIYAPYTFSGSANPPTVYIFNGGASKCSLTGASQVISANAWHLWTVTWANPGSCYLYVDGVQKATAATTGYPGASKEGGPQTTGMYVSNFMAWSVQLTGTQVASMYSDFASVPTGSMVYWYILNTAAASKLDLSGAGHTASVTTTPHADPISGYGSVQQRGGAFVFGDQGSAWSLDNPSAGGTGERWYSAGGPTSGTMSSSSFTAGYQPLYYHQYSLTDSYSVSDSSALPTAPALTCTASGAAGTRYVLTAFATPYWCDATQSWAVTDPVAGGAGEQWAFTGAHSGTVSSGTSSVYAYYHQFQQALRFKWYCNAGHTCSASPTLTYTVNGTAGTVYTLTTAAVVKWADAATTAVASATLTDTSSVVYYVVGGTWTITARNTVYNPIVYTGPPGQVCASYELFGSAGYYSGPYITDLSTTGNVTFRLTTAPQCFTGYLSATWTATNPLPGSNSGRSAWSVNGSSGATYASFKLVYYDQFAAAVSYRLDDSAAANHPTFTYIQNGTQHTWTMSKTPKAFWLDAGRVWSATNPWTTTPDLATWDAVPASGLQAQGPLAVQYGAVNGCTGTWLHQLEQGCFWATMGPYITIFGLQGFLGIVMLGVNAAIWIQTKNGWVVVIVLSATGVLFAGALPQVFYLFALVATGIAIAGVIYRIFWKRA
jgi:hypothetical protein